ncbi:hypothetical protein AC1031_010146 [Aphanomyces cochlioides]|nr:hypothetical protein AC1031_010146 [Aphanomyces cochlioides]
MEDVDGDLSSGNERSWWSDNDDLLLLVQVNTDLPFKDEKNAMKAWDALATMLQSIPHFTRESLDVRKASTRFHALPRAHRKFQKTSAYLSGVDQEENEKVKLLDELLALYDDHKAKKQAERDDEVAKQKTKDDTADYIREQAMLRGRSKSTEVSNSNESESSVSKKSKHIFDVAEMELRFAKERFEFEKQKYENELEERNKDREERRLDREERIQEREGRLKEREDFMTLIRMENISTWNKC